MVANANINQDNLTPTGRRRRRRRTGPYAKGLRTSQAQSSNSSSQMFGTANLQQQEHIATTIGTAVGAACATYTSLLGG